MKIIRPMLAFLALTVSLNAAEVARIAPAEAARRVAAGTAVLVDVREPVEWAKTGVAQPAMLLAKSDFDAGKGGWATFLKTNRETEIILYCHSGRRADVVAKVLAKRGFRVANAGGLRDWKAAGLPVRLFETGSGR